MFTNVTCVVQRVGLSGFLVHSFVVSSSTKRNNPLDTHGECYHVGLVRLALRARPRRPHRSAQSKQNKNATQSSPSDCTTICLIAAAATRLKCDMLPAAPNGKEEILKT